MLSTRQSIIKLPFYSTLSSGTAFFCVFKNRRRKLG